jgi:selenide,water dikinase
MRTLNHAAADVMTNVGVNACVDVTGFGLLGHLMTMLEASDISAIISLQNIPTLRGTLDLLENNLVPGGTYRNLNSVEGEVDWGSANNEASKLLLCDPQTSGGLLIAVPGEKRNELVRQMLSQGVETVAIIGETLENTGPTNKRIKVEP